MKKLVRKRYGYGLIGVLALAITVVSPVWAGDAQAATKKDVEITSKMVDSKVTDSKGNTYWDMGIFDILLGNARTFSNKTELDFNKVSDGDNMGKYAKDLRVFRQIGKYIPGTAQEEKFLYLNGLEDMVDKSSNIKMVTKDKGNIESVVTKVGDEFTLKVPDGVDRKDGVVWMILSAVEGYPYSFKFNGENKETAFEIDTYITVLWQPEYLDEDTVRMNADGSVTVLSSDPEYATTYMCFSTTKIKDEDGDDDIRLDKMVGAYNVANESDFRINEEKMELSKKVCLGRRVDFAIDVTTSRKDKLEVEWGAFANYDLSDYDNKLVATINPIKMQNMGVYYALVTDGTVNKIVSFLVEQDPKDKGNYPIVANLKTLKASAYNEKQKAVKLTWNKATNAKRYAVYRWNGKKWVGLGNTTNNYYVVKNVTAGQLHKYAVRPYQDYYGVNIKSQTYKAVNVVTRPNVVSKVSVAKRASNYVSLKWNHSSGAKGYVVYQYANKKWVKLGTTNSNACMVKKLRKNTTHYFAVLPYTKINGKVVYAKTYTKVKATTTR